MSHDTTIPSMTANSMAAAGASTCHGDRAQRRKPAKPSVRSLRSPKRRGAAHCDVGSGAQLARSANSETIRGAIGKRVLSVVWGWLLAELGRWLFAELKGWLLAELGYSGPAYLSHELGPSVSTYLSNQVTQ